MLNGLSTHQVAHLVTGGQPIHAQNLSQVFRYIIGAAKARYFRIVSPPHVTKADQKIPQRLLALRWALLAGLRLPGVQRTHRQNAIGLLADAHCRQRPAGTHVINEMAPRPSDVVVGQGTFACYTDTEHLQQEVAPGRLPQSRVHVPRVQLLFCRSIGKIGENLTGVRQSKRGCQYIGV
jgi:hypothetical protein